MNLFELAPGDRARTLDGELVEVLSATQDGRTIRVRYVESPNDPSLVGTERLCEDIELQDTWD